jgi:hypothetical protein
VSANFWKPLNLHFFFLLLFIQAFHLLLLKKSHFSPLALLHVLVSLSLKPVVAGLAWDGGVDCWLWDGVTVVRCWLSMGAVIVGFWVWLDMVVDVTRYGVASCGFGWL